MQPAYIMVIKLEIFSVLNDVNRLLSSPTCPVLDALGKKLSFEIAIGLNGRVWVYFLRNYFIVVGLNSSLFPMCVCLLNFYSTLAFSCLLLYAASLFSETSSWYYLVKILLTCRSTPLLHLQSLLLLMELWTQNLRVGYSREGWWRNCFRI